MNKALETYIAKKVKLNLNVRLGTNGEKKNENLESDESENLAASEPPQTAK